MAAEKKQVQEYGEQFPEDSRIEFEMLLERRKLLRKKGYQFSLSELEIETMKELAKKTNMSIVGWLRYQILNDALRHELWSIENFENKIEQYEREEAIDRILERDEAEDTGDGS